MKSLMKFSILMLLSSFFFLSLQAQDYKQIQNRWKTDQYLHNQHGEIEVGKIGAPGWWSAMWKIIPVKGTEFVQIQSRYKPDQYLHNEHGKLEVGKIGAPGWWSAMWKIIPVQGTVFVQIQSRYKPDQYLHNEHGAIEVGRLGAPGWWSAMWMLKTPSAVPNPPIPKKGFSMFFASDSQYPWTARTDAKKSETKSEQKSGSTILNENHIKSMNAIAAAEGNVKGMIMNGDLTAYGHGWQLDKFKEMYAKLKVPMYLGLGNHDYLNNVDDTYENHAANRMVEYMIAHIKSNGSTNSDYKVSDAYEFPNIETTTSGSLAYSWDIENVHFVQLQNFPIYQREWSNYVSLGAAKRKTVKITSALNWLAADLAKARNEGKIIILNFHDDAEHWKDLGGTKFKDLHKTTQAIMGPIYDKQIAEFNKMIADYKVGAIFVGHLHSRLGKFPSSFGKVPLFYCGSASQSKYLLVNFNGDKMSVEHVSSLNGASTRTNKQEYTVYNKPENVPIPKEDRVITFFNEGGYIARYFLVYHLPGDLLPKSFSTGNLALGNKKSFTLPGEATNIIARGEADAVFSWSEIFWKSMSVVPNEDICYKTYGTVFSPQMNNNCE